MPGVGNRGGRAITRSPRVKTEELAEPPLQTKDTPAAEATTKDDGAGSLEDALAQLQMLKEDSAPESSESLEITEDNAFAVRRKHQMAQAMMHVIDFDPNWRVSVSVLYNNYSMLTERRKPFRAYRLDHSTRSTCPISRKPLSRSAAPH